MKVCTIERLGDAIVYDGVKVPSVTIAYKLFRSAYNKALGTANHLKFGHVGQRSERITRVGIDFEESYRNKLDNLFGNTKKVRYYILGLIGSTYCRIFGAWDFGIDLCTVSDEMAEQYLDWLMGYGFGNTMLYGRGDRAGRTNTKFYNNGRRKHKKDSGSECTA